MKSSLPLDVVYYNTLAGLREWSNGTGKVF